jgi:choline transport protein
LVLTWLTNLAAFLYAIAVLYGITDFNAVATSTGSFPLAEAYAQATNRNNGATFGLLFIIFLSLIICLVGTFLTVCYLIGHREYY